MGIVINFTYAQWTAIYPQFATTVSESAFDLTVYPLAQQYCRNDGLGPVSTAQVQTNLLGLMCSHVAQLLFGSSTQSLSPLVGRVSDASEGSVSVRTEMPPAGNPTQAWLYQTQYGAMFWAASSAYRTARYIPAPRRNINPWPYL
jgi:hypothetical protein